MEGKHQKEKQKLLKDKDAGAIIHSPPSHSHIDPWRSEKPTYKGESDKDKDGEPGSGVTKGAHGITATSTICTEVPLRTTNG